MSLEAHNAFINPQRSPAQSVDVEVNDNFVPNVEESRMDAVLEVDDDWDFEGAVGVDEVDYAGV